MSARGFAIVDHVLSDFVIDDLLGALDAAGHRNAIQRRGGIVAIRNLLEVVPAVAELARSAPVRRVAEEVLGPNCFAVRGILFDKTPQTNWKVAWHQDLTIAVKRRFDVPGYGPWSEKAGVASVQPPASILQNIISLRLHLDPCRRRQRARARSSRLARERAPHAPTNRPLACCRPAGRRRRLPRFMPGAAAIAAPLLVPSDSPRTPPRHPPRLRRHSPARRPGVARSPLAPHNSAAREVHPDPVPHPSPSPSPSPKNSLRILLHHVTVPIRTRTEAG